MMCQPGDIFGFKDYNIILLLLRLCISRERFCLHLPGHTVSRISGFLLEFGQGAVTADFSVIHKNQSAVQLFNQVDVVGCNQDRKLPLLGQIFQQLVTDSEERITSPE